MSGLTWVGWFIVMNYVVSAISAIKYVDRPRPTYGRVEMGIALAISVAMVVAVFNVGTGKLS